MTDLELTERLKAAQPAKVRVYDCDDQCRDLAVAKHRRKWSALVATLGHYQWARIECLDGRGGVVAVLERQAPPIGGVEDLATQPGGKAGEVTAHATGLLALMLRAQDVALQRQWQMMTTVMDQQARLLALVADRLTATERAQREDMRTIRELMMELATTDADAQLAEATSGEALLKLAPVIIGALQRKKAPERPGANGKTKED